MLCMQHNWWDATTPCPSCHMARDGEVDEPNPTKGPVSELKSHPAPPITAPVTDATIGCLDALDIPYFLRRNPDGTLMYPELSKCRTATTSALSADQAIPGHISDVIVPTVLTDVTQDQLMEWCSSPELTIDQRQPILRELRRREDRAKAKARIEKMKADMAEKDASCGTKERSPPPSSLSVS